MLQASGSDPPTAPETPPEGGGRLTASLALPICPLIVLVRQPGRRQPVRRLAAVCTPGQGVVAVCGVRAPVGSVGGSGKWTVTTRPGAPSPRVTDPPCAATSSRTIARPSPAPPASRLRAQSSRVNRSNTRSRSAGRDAGPVVGHGHRAAAATVTVTRDRACRTALSTRLASTRRTAPRLGQHRAVVRAGFEHDRDPGRRVPAGRRRRPARRGRPGRRGRRARLVQPGQQQQVVDQPAEPLDVDQHVRRPVAGRRTRRRRRAPPPAGSARWPAGCAARARRRRRTPAAGRRPRPAGPACR